MAASQVPQRIDAVVSNVLKQTTKEHGALFAIQRRWKRLVGKALAAHTKPVSLRRGRLVIHVDRPGDGFALSYQRTQLLEQLQAMAKKGVEDIVIRPGDVKNVRGKCRT